MEEPKGNRMDGGVVLVTGANSGIGRATSLGLARLGATVVMLCRSAKRGEKALRWVRGQSGHEDVHLILADLSRREDIFEAAGEFKSRFRRLDVLVNNAGLVTRKRRHTTDGFELQFFVNHLAYFMLTGLLLDLLKEFAPSRIINVASTAHSRGTLDFDNLQGESHYNGWQQYGNTKLANIVFTYALARRLEGSGVTANCLHPGVIHTNLMSNYSKVVNGLWFLLQGFFKKPDEGALTPVFLASSPDVANESGRYYRNCAPMGTTEESNDPAVQRRLWEVSEALTGFVFPA
jgi:NAD(P)-dependent dehydrogenase (short-subunit alcohol dehydrogenase family)